MAGVTQKLVAQIRIKAEETTVVCITANGLKTTDAIAAEFPATEAIAPRLDAFEAYLDAHLGAAAASAKAGTNMKIRRSKLGRCLNDHPTSIAQNCSLLKTENCELRTQNL